jgi:hypothetical protein
MENMLKSVEQMELQLQSENLEGVPSLGQTSVAAAGTSGTIEAAAPSSSKSTSTQLSDLPDICIAMMLACLSPIEVAKLACVCRSFYDASHSDLVWESFLPPSYHNLLALQPNPPPEFASKKEVFDHLCKPFVTSNRIQVFASLGPKCFLSVCLSLCSISIENLLNISFAILLQFQLQNFRLSREKFVLMKKKLLKSCCCGSLGVTAQGYWLDRRTGGLSMSLSASGLLIVWSDNDRYWEWLEDRASMYVLMTP